MKNLEFRTDKNILYINIEGKIDATNAPEFEEKLNEVESVLASARFAEWLNAPKADGFDFEHYKAIHHFLFSDLYDWAGEIRTVNISKKGTKFTPAENIETQAPLIFKRLKNCNY